ncbi:hypothetical protein [Marinobacter sp. W-8]|uniref:hypothetical protein n=1 Tax=Marinobacter sp. W-8 TaxID=3369658 RepID=UPI0037CBE18D
MNIIRVGVDIAKSVFHVHGVDRHGKTQWQGKYSRQKWLDALSRKVSAGAEIGMEACASSHRWARELQKRGYHPMCQRSCVCHSNAHSKTGVIFVQHEKLLK